MRRGDYTTAGDCVPLRCGSWQYREWCRRNQRPAVDSRHDSLRAMTHKKASQMRVCCWPLGIGMMLLVATHGLILALLARRLLLVTTDSGILRGRARSARGCLSPVCCGANVASSTRFGTRPFSIAHRHRTAAQRHGLLSRWRSKNRQPPLSRNADTRLHCSPRSAW